MVNNCQLFYRMLYEVDLGYLVLIVYLIQQVSFMIFVLVVDSSNMFPIFVLDVGSMKVMFEDYRPYYCNNVSSILSSEM